MNATNTERLYLVEVWGGVEPMLHGPYESEDERDSEALRIFKAGSHEDSLFWASVSADGELAMGAFSNEFLDPDDPS